MRFEMFGIVNGDGRLRTHTRKRVRGPLIFRTEERARQFLTNELSRTRRFERVCRVVRVEVDVRKARRVECPAPEAACGA